MEKKKESLKLEFKFVLQTVKRTLLPLSILIVMNTIRLFVIERRFSDSLCVKYPISVDHNFRSEVGGNTGRWGCDTLNGAPQEGSE